jgi:hypothetical protein
MRIFLLEIKMKAKKHLEILTGNFLDQPQKRLGMLSPENQNMPSTTKSRPNSDLKTRGSFSVLKGRKNGTSANERHLLN